MDSFGMSREPMLEMFVFETNQLSEKLEEILLQSEQDNQISEDNINEIFRIMHTVKGSAGMMMFNNIAAAAHAVEDLFFFIREGKPTNIDYASVCDIVLAALDFIKEAIGEIEGGREANTSEAELLRGIQSVLEVLKGDCSDSNPAPPMTPDQDRLSYYISSYASNSDILLQKYAAKVYFSDGSQMENIRAFTIVHNLKDLCCEICHQPADLLNNDCADAILANGFDLYFATDADQDTVEQVFRRAIGVESYQLRQITSYDDQISDVVSTVSSPEPIVDAHSTVGETHGAKEYPVKGVKQNLISVNVSKLDKLMDLVGEIVITEAMVTRSPDLAGLQLDSFNKAVRQLRKLTDELQDTVMSIRMIPIAATFQKMRRLVRDMGKKLGKEAELITIGEETEVDKNIIDHLSDPLMHLIRNSMDHGIESEAERVRAGKPAIGTITLAAQSNGGDVIITVADDGRGLDKDKIIARAKKNGLLLNRTEQELSHREIYSFILLPGFSTNDQVTEFSGRGVGMDVVKKNIEKVGGNVAVDSIPGQGTITTIKIPLTLAIIDGMEIAIGHAVYTIPTVSIREAFRPMQQNIVVDPDGNEMVMIRGNCYPIVRLHQFFHLMTDVTDLTKGIIIVTESNTKTICLFADQLLGEQQVVVKPLPTYLAHYHVKQSGVAGCTILGDGSISLILDTTQMADQVI